MINAHCRSVKVALVLSVLTLFAWSLPAFAQLPGGTLDPTKIRKYVRPLTVLPSMPKSQSGDPSLDYYEIALRQFKQEVVPGKPTTVWGYGSISDPGSFSYPAYTIEAMRDRPVRVKWINDLVGPNGDYLPHLLPIDQTLHWANPPGGGDTMGMDPTAYTGPVPMVPHLHGAHVTQESDGYPEAWFLPAAKNIPAGYATVGSKYAQFKAESEAAHGQTWEPGTAVFQYPNDQRPATLWFHDHSLGMTRANVYAGPAGLYLIRGGPDDIQSGLPSGAFEIGLVIQDRSFNIDGSLFYPDNRAFFEGLSFPTHREQFNGAGSLNIPFIPDMTLGGMMSDISPIWNPEFFGNTMVVNGKTWPYVDVEPRLYRFRLLNASDSRFLILKLSNGRKFWQIGNDGGFLARPAELQTLLIAPAERVDVLIDFSQDARGSSIILQNVGPDEPFGGGVPGVDFISADPNTTGQVMQFRVARPLNGTEAGIQPAALTMPAITPISGPAKVRKLSLNELMSMSVWAMMDPLSGDVNEVPAGTPGAELFGPAKAQLGTMVRGAPVAHAWMDPVTETPKVNETEIWELYNFTADAHPIHIHQVQFEVVGREFKNKKTAPEPWETGFKDTVIAYPGDEAAGIPGITRVKVKFDIPGLYVWHCHILSHEDNEMMRPINVL